SLGDNTNGPSLVRVPESMPHKLGRYYLYFSHHKGQFIRLAYADQIEGPWTIHTPGVLPLSETPFAQCRPDLPQPGWATKLDTDGLYPHLASPDVRVLPDRRLEMFVHGLAASGEQVSYRAESTDALRWKITGSEIPETYMRLFTWHGDTYAMARCSRLMRLEPEGWQLGQVAIAPEVRHVAVLVHDDLLHVLFTRIGDSPERLLHTRIDLRDDWLSWQADDAVSVLCPEMDWEGAGEPVQASVIGAEGFSNALRDPCLFEDDGRVWVVYAGGAEHALGLAELSGI
ncbi:MAG: hypothetical protein AAF479_16825, partial [Pseudomonadota bacterium]